VKPKQKMDEFKLRIAGVCLGTYTFSIDCDKEFFEISEISELQDGLLKLQIEMEKTETMLNLKFHFKGTVTAMCDRCLDPVTIPMNFKERLIVKLTQNMDEVEESDDNIWVINENEYELDIFHFVYEAIRLALPLKIVHPNDKMGNSTCNPEVLKKLEKYSHKESEIDPRWEGLKNIKLD
jgi:uncharacterized protein